MRGDIWDLWVIKRFEKKPRCWSHQFRKARLICWKSKKLREIIWKAWVIEQFKKRIGKEVRSLLCIVCRAQWGAYMAKQFCRKPRKWWSTAIAILKRPVIGSNALNRIRWKLILSQTVLCWFNFVAFVILQLIYHHF